MHHLRIPTKEQYAYIEIDFKGTSDEALREYRRLTNLVNGTGNFRDIKTFTGEVIQYDEDNHIYQTLDGKRLLSGSAYKKSLEKPFPPEMAQKVADKYGMPVEDVRAMWQMNGFISSKFGDSVHKALELYKKYHKHKDALKGEKEYYLPINQTIREAVLAFPELHDEGYSEIMVSDIREGRVGQIDRLKVIGEKEGIIEDYKSDADIKKNLERHWNQLSFYAHILIAHGWTIPLLRVWNLELIDGKYKWVKYESEVLEIITK